MVNEIVYKGGGLELQKKDLLVQHLPTLFITR